MLSIWVARLCLALLPCSARRLCSFRFTNSHSRPMDDGATRCVEPTLQLPRQWARRLAAHSGALGIAWPYAGALQAPARPDRLPRLVAGLISISWPASFFTRYPFETGLSWLWLSNTCRFLRSTLIAAWWQKAFATRARRWCWRPPGTFRNRQQFLALLPVLFAVGLFTGRRHKPRKAVAVACILVWAGWLPNSGIADLLGQSCAHHDFSVLLHRGQLLAWTGGPGSSLASSPGVCLPIATRGH